MKPRILIVHRDPDVREILCAALRHAGYEPQALSAPDRLLCEAPGCALVITDYPTSAADASTVTRALRESPRTSAIPILNATTHALPAELEEARGAGVTETIVLPTHLEAIVAKVRTMVPDPRGT